MYIYLYWNKSITVYRFASAAFKSYISPAPIISTVSTSFACDLTKSTVDLLSFAR